MRRPAWNLLDLLDWMNEWRLKQVLSTASKAQAWKLIKICPEMVSSPTIDWLSMGPSTDRSYSQYYQSPQDKPFAYKPEIALSDSTSLMHATDTMRHFRVLNRPQVLNSSQRIVFFMALLLMKPVFLRDFKSARLRLVIFTSCGHPPMWNTAMSCRQREGKSW